jgi:O-antigen/teichoic acid export membrane protein
VTPRTISFNFALNMTGSVLPLLTALVTVPLYISHIGAARYGILAVVWILLGYSGFLDFGLSRASAIALSRLGNAGPAQRVPVLVTALYLNAAFGLVGGLLLYGAAGLLLGRFTSVPADLAAEVQAALPCIAAMLPVALVSGVGSGSIESREQFLLANVLQTTSGVLGQVAPVLCAILIGPSLTVVLTAALATRVFSTAVVWLVVRRLERPIDLRRFDPGRLRELLGFGAWVSISSVVSPVMESFDQMLIAAILGPASVAHYSVPMNLATRSQIVAGALARTLFPRLSRLAADEARWLASRAVVTLAFSYGAACGPAVLLAGPFLRLWVGEEFAAQATPAAQILLIGAWANGIAFIPFGLLQGQGRPDVTAKLHMLEVLPFLLGSYGLMVAAGVSGAAVAWTARTVADCLLLLWLARCWSPYLVRAVPAVGLMAASWLLAQVVPAPLPWALGSAVVIGLLFALSALVLDPTLREAARKAAGSVLARILGTGRPRWLN